MGTVRFFRYWAKLVFGLAGLSVTVLPANAQLPRAAGKSAFFDASLGYTYSQMNVPGSNSVGMGGPNLVITGDFFPHIGARADLAYMRSQTAFGSDHHNDAFTYLGGPVLHVLRTKRLDLYADALLGGARLTGVNISKYGGYSSGYVVRPAWSFGGGGQYTITRSVSVRIGAEYVRTTFFDQAAALKSTYSLRESISLVYSFIGGHRR